MSRYTWEAVAKILITDPSRTLTIFLGNFSIHPSPSPLSQAARILPYVLVSMFYIKPILQLVL